jgi:hypothetical protein
MAPRDNILNGSSVIPHLSFSIDMSCLPGMSCRGERNRIVFPLAGSTLPVMNHVLVFSPGNR